MAEEIERRIRGKINEVSLPVEGIEELSRRTPPVGRAAEEPRARPSRAGRRAAKAEIDDPAIVLEAALRFLEVRARSTAEVRRRLTSAGYRGDLVDGAVERLTELGVLDDEQFAQAWVESRDAERGPAGAGAPSKSGAEGRRPRSQR